MRRLALHAALATAAASTIIVAGVVRARPGDTFVLEDRDKLLVEAPGCHASCGLEGTFRRVCSVREPDCRAICQPLPECNPGGVRPMHVCVVVKEQR